MSHETPFALAPLETPAGGVMTDTEDGVLSGQLILRIALSDSGEAEVSVAYAGTDDWYPVEGSPTAVAADEDLSALAMSIVAHLASDEGLDEAGNPRYTTLADFPRA